MYLQKIQSLDDLVYFNINVNLMLKHAYSHLHLYTTSYMLNH